MQSIRQNYTSVYSFDCDGDVLKVGYFRNIPDEFKIKSLYSNDCQTRHGWRWFPAAATFLHSKNSPMKNVQGRTFFITTSHLKLKEAAQKRFRNPL